MHHERAEPLSGLIESAPFGIYVVDSDFRLMQISEGARKVFSVVRDPIGKDFAEVLGQIWPEPFLSEALSRFRHTLATGETYHAPSTVEDRAGTGSTEAYDWKLERVLGLDGRHCVVCYFFDLTERQRSLDLLRQASERDHFRARLDDALRPLVTAEQIWVTAATVLGKYLRARRVAWSEEVGDGEHFVVLPHFADGAPEFGGRFRYADYGTGIFEQLRAGIDRIHPDIQRDEHISDSEKAILAASGIGASLAVPVIKEERLVAFLSIHYSTAHEFTSDEIELVHDVANRTWSVALRAQAEAALRDSEEKYRALFESIDQGYCVAQIICDSEGHPTDYRFEQINPAFTELTGLPAHAVGRTARELVPNLEPFWVDTYGRVGITGEPVRFEDQSRAMNRWFDVYALRLGAPADRRIGILFTNITARKTRELHTRFLDEIGQQLVQLSSSEEIMLRVGTHVGEFLNLSGCVFADVDEDRNEVKVHVGWMDENVPTLKQQTFRLAEYVTPEFSRANRAGEPFVVCDSAHDERIDAAQYALLQIGAFVTVPVLRNGKWVAYLIATSVTPRDWQPEEVELLREVSERLFTRVEGARTEAAMRESEERLQLAIKIGEFASWDWDLASEAITWNDRHYLLQGYAVREVLPSFDAWRARVHPDDRETTIARIEHARTFRTTYVHEYRNLLPNGDVVWCSARGRFFYDAQGEPYRMIGVMENISERKRAERALQTADRRKDEFLATLAHELRNPLAPIRNGVELLRITGNRTPEERDLLGMVDRQLTHMVRLVDDLMDVSRISVGKLRLQYRPTAVQTVLDEAIEACRGTIVGAGHTFVVNASDSLPVLELDCARMVQVLSNLLTNAARYTERGGRIELRAFTQSQWMVFEVEDNGMGIPIAAQAGLFELFSQVDVGAHRSQGGLGIGLNLVKRLVELHKGDVSVDSEPGRGSTFSVRLPLHEVAMIENEHTVSHTSRTARRVLIVDDNIDAARTLSMLLENVGCRTSVAHSGHEGVAAVVSERPDVVVLDIGLPDMDGYAVARKIRDISGKNAPLLVALTGFGQDEDKRRAQQAGFDQHFTKPVKPEKIREMIARSEASGANSGERSSLGSTVAHHPIQPAPDTRHATSAASRNDIRNVLPFAAISIDANQRITFVNEHGEQLANTSRADLLGRVLSEVIPPLANAQVAATLARVPQMSAGAGERINIRYAGNDLDVWIEPDTNGGGSLYVTTRPAQSESKQISTMRETFDRELRLYETVLGGTPDFAYIWSLNYKFLYANASLLTLYGLPAEKVIGYGFRDVGYPEWHASMHEREIDEVVRTRKPLRGKIPFYAKGGGGIYDYIFVPVLGPDGEVEAVGGITRDVTELDRAGEALKEADRRKDEFLATLAHELRNPLAPLLTGLRLVQDQHDVETSSNALATMERHLKHVVHLVDDLMDLSRVSRGAIELQYGRHDLRRVLQDALEIAQPLLQQRKHNLVWRVPDQELAVEGDDTRLGQVFSNLLSNAAKYTAVGGTVTVDATIDDEQVVVRVTDTGVGISEEDLPRVFEMFAQVKNPVDQSQGGLGIGLHVVRRLVTMHGGAIDVDSAGLGTGSTFTVTLPISHAAQRSNSPTPKPVIVRPRRVMIVDDNVDAAFLLSLLLKKKGHEVHATYGALDALDLARTFRPEVIFLDIGMPDLDGYEACRRIRQMDGVGHAYIVALTGWGQEDDRRKAREAGFDAHLVKPCDPERIDELLAEMPERLAPVT